MDHYTLLFVSVLAAGAPLDSVAGIARQARANNARTGITGLLVFDGQRFAQVMEGPQRPVETVARLMETDPRHERMQVLHAGPIAEPRRYPNWRLGYLLLDLQEFGLEGLSGLKGPAALDAFNFMLPALDIAMGEAIPGQLERRTKRS